MKTKPFYNQNNNDVVLILVSDARMRKTKQTNDWEKFSLDILLPKQIWRKINWQLPFIWLPFISYFVLHLLFFFMVNCNY